MKSSAKQYHHKNNTERASTKETNMDSDNRKFKKAKLTIAYPKEAPLDCTCLCVDIYQSTKQISGLDVEEARLWVEEALNIMSRCAKRYDGKIEEFTGDGLIVIFQGESHQLRSCFAGMLLQTLLHRMEIPVGARVALNAISAEGSDREKSWAKNKGVAMTQGLQDHAEVGGVIISHSVHEILGELINTGAAARISLADGSIIMAYPLQELSNQAKGMMRLYHKNHPMAVNDTREEYLTLESEGERKYVTGLFLKIISSDPKEAEKGLSIAESIFSQFEGFILKRAGDVLFSIFGAPVSLEDHPLRACIAANTFVKNFMKMKINAKFKMGINSGEVVMDQIGGEEFHQYDAIGASVNLAARMMQTAQINQIQLSQVTFNLVKSYVEVTPLGEKHVKGFSEGISTYSLEDINIEAIRNRMEASLYARTTFIGRKKDIDNLLKKYSKVEDNQFQLLGICSDAGLGKSRLSFEFAQIVREKEGAIYDTTCSVYDSKVPFSALKQLLETLFFINTKDFDIKKILAFKDKLSAFHFTEELAAESLMAMLGVDLAGTNWSITSPIVQKRILLNTMTEYLKEKSSMIPLVLIFDDFQWSDEETLLFLRQCLPMLKSQKMMMIFLYRKEFELTKYFDKEEISKEIFLSPLDKNACHKLISELLPGKGSIEAVRDKVVELSEGNPLLTQEYVDMLVQNQGVEEKLDGTYVVTDKLELNNMPVSMHDVIAARIDRMPKMEKRLLLEASILGKEFPLAFLRYLTELDDASFKTAVEELEKRGFIHELSPVPELQYSFSNNSICDVAYKSILKKDKQKYHRSLVEKIEEDRHEYLKNYYYVLAHHSQEGALFGKAIHYYNTVVPNEPNIKFPASQYIVVYQQAENCYKQLSKEEQKNYFREYARIKTMLAFGYFIVSDIERAIVITENLAVQAEDMADPFVKMVVMLWPSMLSIMAGQCSQSESAIRKILSHIDEIKETIPEEQFDILKADLNLILVHAFGPLGKYALFDDSFNQVMDSKISFYATSPFLGSSSKAVTLGHYGFNNMIRANLTAMEKYFPYIHDVLKNKLPPSESLLLLQLYFAQYWIVVGDFNKAKTYLLESHKIAEEIQHDFGSLMLLCLDAYVEYRSNNMTDALSHARMYLEAAQQVMALFPFGIQLAIEVLIRAGATDEALVFLDSMQSMAEADSQKPTIAQCYRLRASAYNLIAKDHSQDNEILRLLNESRAIVDEIGCRYEYPMIELTLAEFYQRLGETEKVKMHHQKALSYFKEYGMTGWYDDYKNKF